MKNTFKIFGIIAAVAVISFSILACDNGSPAVTPPGYTPTAGLYTGTPSAATRVALDLTETNLVAAAIAHINHTDRGYDADNPGTYTLVITANVETAAQPPLQGDRNLTVTGIGAGRTIQLTGTGSMFTLNAQSPGSSLTLNNITLSGVSNNTTALVWLNNNTVTLTVNAGTRITGNTVVGGNNDNAGGVSAQGGGSIVMNSGVISGNTAVGNASGGGVRVAGGATFVMHNGEISDNTATGLSAGGGVRVVGTGSVFTMHAGVISDNTATRGGGVIVDTAGTFVMNSGLISDNTVTDTLSGGGVLVAGGNAVFTMNAGVISNNTANAANSGGGVRVQGGAAFNMHGSSEIMENRTMGSDSAGGVYVTANDSVFTMFGGEILDNVAEGNLSTGGVMVITGNATLRMVNGRIDGEFESGGSGHAALWRTGANTIAQHGTFSDPANPATWQLVGNLPSTTHDLVHVINGVLQGATPPQVSITITGIPGTHFDADDANMSRGRMEVYNTSWEMVAEGEADISSGGSMTVALVDGEGTPWNGSGQHHILLNFPYYGGDYYFTNGQDFDDLLPNDFDPNVDEYRDHLPTFNITAATHSIALTQFRHDSDL